MIRRYIEGVSEYPFGVYNAVDLGCEPDLWAVYEADDIVRSLKSLHCTREDAEAELAELTYRERVR